MMNNKGQVLVMFVILLPLILLLISLVVDMGMLYSEKRNVDNNVKSAITYGLENIDDNNIKFKINNLLKENISDIDSLYIDVTDNKITVNLIKKQTSIFNIVNLKKAYQINSKYVGYLNEGKIELLKE